MIYVLYTLFILSCVVIVVSILLQPGKADAGALFTSSVSSTAFGPRGTQTLLAKITIIAAAVFMLSALLISVPYFTGGRSVLQSVGEEPAPATTPAPQQTTQPPPATTTDNNPAATNATATNGNASGAQKSQPANDNKQSNNNAQANQNKK
ncbi:MAG: preprotein translocase subunit SecG [Acidobacteriota bacterium]|nr:preprotein translocase subunit SecG [Acidobacteriota bacterium]